MTHTSQPRRRPASARSAGVLAITAAIFVLAACSAGTGGQSTTPSTVPSAAASTPESMAASVPPASEPAAAGTTIQVADSTLGQILTDGDGNTVYLFTPDSANTSTCATGCIDTWPPVTVEAGTAPQAGDGVTATLGTITRDDGTLQVTVNELPIYFFAGDTAPGATNGQNVGGKWFVATADGSMNQGAAASVTSTNDGGYAY